MLQSKKNNNGILWEGNRSVNGTTIVDVVLSKREQAHLTFLSRLKGLFPNSKYLQRRHGPECNEFVCRRASGWGVRDCDLAFESSKRCSCFTCSVAAWDVLT